MYDELSKDDIRKIKEEIEHRKVVVRHEALDAVKEARAQGDLSENFEYYAAKKEKNRNESRIRYLEKMLKTAKVIEDSSANDEIGLNNTVTVYYEEDEEKEIFRIVTTIRADPLKGLISIDSPIGKALMGHKVGDRVLVQLNAQTSYYLKVLQIEKTVDESDDEIRRY